MWSLDHVYFEGNAPATTPRAVPVSSRSFRQLRRDQAGELPEFLAWLLQEAGLNARDYHGRSLSRRLGACLRELRVGTPEDAHRVLTDNPALVPRAIDCLLLGVTQFFRDGPVFACLQDHVLPVLLRHPEPLRVWSAACSDGHELYSVAMVLDALGRLGGADLLGTDCRASAIARATAGVYAAEYLAQIDPDLKARYFPGANATVRVSGPLRAATRWAQQDLFRGAAPGPWDLILWRNMAIYLAPAAAEKLWHSIWRQLRPGGFLITGKADHPPPELKGERIASCVYQKWAPH